VPNNMFSGARFSAGMWFARCCNLGFDTNFFFLGRQQNTSIFPTTNTLLARPFFDAELGAQDAEIFTPGTVTIHTYSQLWGAEANFRHKWRCGPNHWVDFFWGYRHLNLSEGIDITEDLTVPTVVGPLRIVEQESFRTRNLFNGLQAGLEGECRFWNRCWFGWRTQLAMGATHQIINIDGSTSFTAAPIGTITQQGALLATPTNIGRYTANRFAVVPEIGVKLGYDLTDHLRIFAGYDFLYWSSVVRPGDQIDLNVSPSFRPTIFGPGAGGGPRQPAVLYNTSAYWAQGFTFGLMYRY
jgi:Putative beta barrel porin-7 (BBP7)